MTIIKLLKDCVSFTTHRKIIIASLMILPTFLLAQNSSSVITTAAPVLRITGDARAAALGEAGIATSPDAASIFYNAAKISFAEEKFAMTLNHSSWLREITSGIYMLNVSGYHKLDDKQAIGGGVRFYNTGKIEERDNNGNLLQLVNPREFSVEGFYSRLLSDKISMSAGFRYLVSSLGKTVYSTQSAANNAFLGDISFFYNGLDDDGKGITAGAVIANIGTGKIIYGNNNDNGGFVPARIGVGAAYTNPFDDENKMMFTVDFNKSMVPMIPDGVNGMQEYLDYSILNSYAKGIGNDALSISIGAEYEYKKLLSIRAGYFTESNSYGGRKYISAGFGIKLTQFGLNFGYIIPSGDQSLGNAMSNTLRLGIVFTPQTQH